MKGHNVYRIAYGLLLTLFSCQPTVSEHLQYLAQEKPAAQPKIFAEQIVSKTTESEFGSVFNKKGDEFFYGVDLVGKAEIRYTKLEQGQWRTPQTIIVHDQYSYNDPFLSPDEQKLFYISDMPRNGQDTIRDYDIWFSEKRADGWSAPINAGTAINSDKNEYYVSFTNSGTMYFASNRAHEAKQERDFDIYRAVSDRGIFQTPERLSDAVNTKAYEADVFVAPDESYLIFCATRRTGLGRGDLYISFKAADGNWSEAISMGDTINTSGHELCPFVTADGQYFFYTSNQDIYWVDMTIIEKLRAMVR